MNINCVDDFDLITKIFRTMNNFLNAYEIIYGHNKK